MNLRVRMPGDEGTVKVRVEAGMSLGSFVQRVAPMVQAAGVDRLRLGVSLNGKDVLEGEESTLDELGVRGGDLLRVVPLPGAGDGGQVAFVWPESPLAATTSSAGLGPAADEDPSEFAGGGAAEGGAWATAGAARATASGWVSTSSDGESAMTGPPLGVTLQTGGGSDTHNLFVAGSSSQSAAAVGPRDTAIGAGSDPRASGVASARALRDVLAGRPRIATALESGLACSGVESSEDWLVLLLWGVLAQAGCTGSPCPPRDWRTRPEAQRGGLTYWLRAARPGDQSGIVIKVTRMGPGALLFVACADAGGGAGFRRPTTLLAKVAHHVLPDARPSAPLFSLQGGLGAPSPFRYVDGTITLLQDKLVHPHLLGLSPLQRLPKDLKLAIMARVGARGTLSLGVACSDLARCAEDEGLWLGLLHRDWPSAASALTLAAQAAAAAALSAGDPAAEVRARRRRVELEEELCERGDINWLEGVALPAGLPGTLALKRQAIACAVRGAWRACYRRLLDSRAERRADERAEAEERARRRHDPLIDSRGLRGGPGMPHPGFPGVPGIVGGDYDLFPGGIRPGGGGFPAFPGFPGGGFSGGGGGYPDEFGLNPSIGPRGPTGMGPLGGLPRRGQPPNRFPGAPHF